ncbi:Bifunctional 3-dehydroquinate dehydratase/shikimate dehydrogenase isoform 1 [Hibiscus syriacus]|uniref:Bifunctional 3-dehydroquinate dehydratase/shikimate dehydrogenase isoform 1 n=1 Tax=Hibiscus syriacus TaxID=106335 RepID=A0A6A3BPU6_HIBSY|nr:uncharacterized protein LOC120212291 [Hibiscus syriacus]KAE8718624.1 Bifunctional 3-dehydroquinate dehydratase/shikimate dehydrogenase isoform 1 [Hibiscus syriacus]
MECNKEEAIRAKVIAEQKMQNGDFEAAKKFALRAQKLFPELDNITQLMAVCNVHYFAKHSIYGSEKDWYGILQTEQSAGESLIKKQFRKLALLLHPDKNKFPGAEAAFKLIGEANRVLSDQMARSQYDLKCRVLVKTIPKPTFHPSNRASSVNSQSGFANNYKNCSSNFTASNAYQQAQHLTFWTLCSVCGFKFQSDKDFVNRMLRCLSCGSIFIAHDLGPQGYSWNQFSNQVPYNTSSHYNSGKPSGVHIPHKFAESAPIPKAGSFQVGGSKKQEKVGVKMHQSKEGFTAQKVDESSNMRDRKKGVEKCKPTAAKPKESGTSRNAKKKRGWKSVEESDVSCETGRGIKVENVVLKEDCNSNTRENSNVNEGHPSRRPSRQKQPISYEEKIADDDDDFESPYKKSKVMTPPNANEGKVDDEVMKKDNSGGFTTAADVCKKEVKQKASDRPEEDVMKKKRKTVESKGKEEETVILDKNKVQQFDSGFESSRDVNPTPQELEYPDPEFTDFEKYRSENIFAVNQVWAIYDTLDGMPRFYARVKKVYRPGFKLQITWLEPDPGEENQQNWVDLDLPVSCGKYCNGSSEVCVDRLMFSHWIDPIKLSSKCFFVYPRKGEIWALFKDWDVKWVSEPEKHKPPYQYDFVEVLTDFDKEVGIGVAHLGKVKGFVSIFRQTERDGVISFQISSFELYRFAHQVPSFRMTGNEREGIPVGSFELDPAALPTYLFELVDSGDMKLSNHNAENCSSPNHPQNQAKATIDSERNLTPVNNHKGNIEKEASVSRKSTRGSRCVLKDHGGQVDAVYHKNEDESIEAIRDCNLIQPKGSSISNDAVQEMNTQKKCEKIDLTTDCLKPRRSPSDLSSSQANACQNDTRENGEKHLVSNKNEKHGIFGNTEGKVSLNPAVGNMHLHEGGGGTVDVTKSSSVSTPMSLARKTSNLECYDFKREKSEDKFSVDQIWALYCGDGMPKNYSQVKKIEATPDFRLHVALLEVCSRPKDLKLPICCGIFKVKSGQTKVVSCNEVSHQVRVEPTGKNRFKIFPRKGEVWAIYKRWSSADSDLGKGECDIVEVLEDNEKKKKVMVLSCLNSSKPLYRAPRSQRSTSGVLEIPETEFARFSHQIPAFQHTGEDSRWRGYWELDPSALTGIICLD